MRSLYDFAFVAMFRYNIPGRTRLWNWYSGIAGETPCLRMPNKFGVELSVDPTDYVDGFIIREGFYESVVFESIIECVSEGDVFWDIGANSGLHAITLAKLRPHVQVVAFEPSANEIFRIVRSSKRSGARIEVIPCALSDRVGFEMLYLCQSNAGRNTLLPEGEHYADGKTIASCITGDFLCSELNYRSPNVVKIDVEGLEYNVLSGMFKILASGKCKRLIFEAGLDAGERHNPIHQYLSAFGCNIRVLQRREATAHDLHNFCADLRVSDTSDSLQRFDRPCALQS